MTKKNKKTALSREDILNKINPLPEKDVFVRGLGYVTMQNIPYEEFVQTLIDAGGERADQNTMIVAKVVKELQTTDAIKLRRGNGVVFTMLKKAVDDYLNYGLSEGKIKN